MTDTLVRSAELRERVTAFLTQEADLADCHRFDEWLELWSEEGRYWVPCNADDYNPALHVSIIFDDYSRLQERCFRLSSEGVHSQDPRSRLCRIINNLQVSQATDAIDELEVLANMVLVEVRSGEKNLYGARLKYRLVPDGDSFKIKLKKVMLLDNDEPQGNLTFLL